MPRMRTATGALEIIKQQDPDTAVTLHYSSIHDSHNKTAFLVANIGIRLDDDIHDLGCGLHQVCHSIRWDIKAGSCEETLFFSL